jgi:hypothetical protein
MCRRILAAGLLLLAALVLPGCPLLSLLRQASAYQAKPIPAAPTARTEKDFSQIALRFNRRTMVEAYRQGGRRSPAWDEAAEQYLDTWAQFFAGPIEVPKWDGVIREGERLLAAGCDDPLVLYCHGVAFQCAGNLDKATELIGRALPLLEESSYSPLRGALAAMRLAELDGGPRKLAERIDSGYWDRAVQLLVRAVATGTYQKGEQRLLLRHVDAYWDPMPVSAQRDLCTALGREKKTDPYALAVLRGMNEIEAAWEARGSDWASDVTKEGWKGFAEHLRTARHLLTEAWQAHPEYPEAPARMIMVTGGGYGGPGETIRTWFDRAVAAEFDYPFAYESFLWFSHPRWGGDHDDMYRFGLECLDTGRFDTDVPLFFMTAVNNISNDMDGDTAIWRNADTQRQLARMFAGYLRETAGVKKDHFRSLQAAAAWRSQRYEQARELLEQPGDEVHEDVFADWFATPFRVAKAEIYGFSGQRGVETRRAEDLGSRGQVSQALAAYQQIAASGDLGNQALDFVNDRIADLRREQDLASGKWVTLMPPADLFGWSKDEGRWSVEENGTIRGTSGSNGLWLRCKQQVSSRLALEGEMQLAAEGRDEAPNCALTVHVGDEDEDTDAIMWAVSRPKQETMLKNTARKTDALYVKAEVKDWSTFRLELWGNYVTTYLNGKLVNREVKMGSAPPGARATVAIGSFAQYAGVVVRFRNLRVKQLTRKPVPVGVLQEQ